MTRENKVICDRCGETVKPPKNSGWIVLMVVGPDGLTFCESAGDLCEMCAVQVVKFAHPKQVVAS
jgi:hypothetical protein